MYINAHGLQVKYCSGIIVIPQKPISGQKNDGIPLKQTTTAIENGDSGIPVKMFSDSGMVTLFSILFRHFYHYRHRSVR
jgi:hypothetical protein